MLGSRMAYLDQFHFEILGLDQSEKLVFLHGLMGAGSNWRGLAKSFEKDFQILLFDQRGHGRSFHPDGGYTSEDYAEDLFKILAELGWEKIHLVGHSLGARNAMVFACKYPEKVQSLVIEDISPSASGKSGPSKTEQLILKVPVPFESRQQAKAYFMGEFLKGLEGDPQAQTLANFFYMNIQEFPDGRVDWRFSKNGILESLREGRTKDRWPEWKSLKAPLSLIRGEFSEDLIQKDYDEMLRQNPSAEGWLISGAGHWVHFDQQQAFAAALEKHLEQARALTKSAQKV